MPLAVELNAMKCPGIATPMGTCALRCTVCQRHLQGLPLMASPSSTELPLNTFPPRVLFLFIRLLRSLTVGSKTTWLAPRTSYRRVHFSPGCYPVLHIQVWTCSQPRSVVLSLPIPPQRTRSNNRLADPLQRGMIPLIAKNYLG